MSRIILTKVKESCSYYSDFFGFASTQCTNTYILKSVHPLANEHFIREMKVKIGKLKNKNMNFVRYVVKQPSTSSDIKR